MENQSGLADDLRMLVTSISSQNQSTAVTSDLTRLVVTINYVIISASISCFGICSNAINIAVFVKQGFQDTINLTLLAITLSDVFSLIALLWQIRRLSAHFQKVTPFTLAEEVQAITGIFPYLFFMRFSAWLTAFMTFERCLCVLSPLKVKVIFTSTNTTIVIVGIFVFSVAGFVPNFFSLAMALQYPTDLNQTVYSDRYARVRQLGSIFGGMIFTWGSSIVVVVSTLFLVVSLNRQTKWRQKIASAQNVGENKGKTRNVNKEKAVIKMVVGIALIFIVCLIVPSLITTPIGLMPEFKFGGKYGNLQVVIASLICMFGAVNASSNIFIYHAMSTNYRSVFQEMFMKRWKR